MPHHILLLIDKKSSNVVSATFAYTSMEVTMITRECESEECYVKTFECDYAIRRDTVPMSDLKPKYIVLLVNKKAIKVDPTNFSAASFACNLDEVAAIIQEYTCDYYGIKTLKCDYKMRGE